MAYQFNTDASNLSTASVHATWRNGDWANFGCWFYVTALGTTRNIVTLLSGSGDFDGYYLQVTSANKVYLGTNVAGKTSSVTSSNSVSLNTWHLALCSLYVPSSGSNNVQIYVSLDGTTTSITNGAYKPTDVPKAIYCGISSRDLGIAEFFMLTVPQGIAYEVGFSVENAQLRDGWRIIRSAKWRNSILSYWPLDGRLVDVVGGYTLTANDSPVESAHPRILG